MKLRLRLSDEEVALLNLSKNKRNQYNISGEDKIRKLFTYRGYDQNLIEECIKLGVNPTQINNYWHKGKHFSIHSKTPDENHLEKLADTLIKELDEYSPQYPEIKRTKNKADNLLVIDPADIHIGKLCSAFETGEKYNSQIAVKRVKQGVQGILDKSSGFGYDKILFIAGNDVLHVDNPSNKTTSGTQQDTDGMWYDNFLIGKRLYVDILEMLIAVADVHFMFNPSNHDFMSGFMLSEVIRSHFRKNENITFDCSMQHRKYFRYHSNLIGSSHGDGAKQNDLPLLMANESKHWSKCKNRYMYIHHIHHKMSKDHPGVTVESLRSPSATDSWHHKKGFQHAPQAIEGFVHDKKHGQVARFTHLF